MVAANPEHLGASIGFLWYNAYPASMMMGDVGALSLSLNWQFLGLAVFVVGLQAFFLGCIAQILFDYTGQRTRRWLRTFRYTRSVLIAARLITAVVSLAGAEAMLWFGGYPRWWAMDAP